MNELSGSLDGSDLCFGIAVSRWNDVVTRRLLSGASELLTARSVPAGSVTVAWVPGAFELPLACQAMAETGRFDALIALGCVIRGGTDHYVHVATQCADGLARVSLDQRIPVVFGVLTTESIEDALERSGEGLDNKGYEAAQTAIELAQLLGAIRGNT